MESTTQGLPNRLRDRDRVYADLGLAEFPEGTNSPGFCLYLRCGDFAFDRSTSSGSADPQPTTLISSRGYRRIVFGDHGPYLEFTRQQLHLESFPFARKKPSHAFYDEHWFLAAAFLARLQNDRGAAGGGGMKQGEHLGRALDEEAWGRVEEAALGEQAQAGAARTHAFVYEQKRSVKSKPNPPHTGRWWCDNNRDEGYADYQPGYFYLECSAEVVLVVRRKDENEHVITGAIAQSEDGTNQKQAPSAKRSKWRAKAK
eukprot:g2754.t1